MFKIRLIGAIVILASVVTIGGCGDSNVNVDLGPDVDLGVNLPDGSVEDGGEDIGIVTVCGDFRVQGLETCDDGNMSEDDLCLNNCQLACGDGVLNAIELCDPAIAAGQAGECPTVCDSGNACMTGVPVGDGCNVECVFGEITACQNDDGCCAPGCNANNDNDCGVMCGNGVIETGETCESGIGAGCPGTCNDGVACTADSTVGDSNTCDIACTNSPISACSAGDGCCPSGCNASNDLDCAAVCGNSVVESGELCDTGIASGAGSCPTACNDGLSCTTDTLVGSACQAECVTGPITVCASGDGCCAGGCNNTNDIDCNPMCGNMVVEMGESCDGNCPTGCSDANACTTDALTGSPSSCDVTCSNTAITVCNSGDGCCAPGCNNTNDTDCSPSCGNNVVENGELCDGACPTTCSDANSCTTNVLMGTGCQRQCSNAPVTSCGAAEGCCPTGCNNGNDADCMAMCGNAVVELGESCDGNCPATCADANACTTDTLTGTAGQCNVTCTNTTITSCTSNDGCCAMGCNSVNDNDCSASCGNGITEGTETCDGNCPTTCADGNSCTTDTLSGTPAQCNVVCSNTAITACANNDGCCAPGCNANNDNSCGAMCGNSVVEAGETCDPSGTCPSCNDMNACTTDTQTGSAGSCNVACTNTAITVCANNDGCCAPGCNANNDNSCTPSCGNNVTEGSETCDGNCPASCNDANSCTTDVRSGTNGQCNVVCTNNPVTACASNDGCCAPGCNANNDNDCSAMCGNNVVETPETCDGNCPASCNDANSCTTDVRTGTNGSCNVTCANNAISACVNSDGCCAPGCNAGNDNDCVAVCGNGVREGSELCDTGIPSGMGSCPAACNDANACTTDTLVGSACQAQCSTAAITMCGAAEGCCPAGCNMVNDVDCVPMCGNMVIESGETCDDNNLDPNDGCDMCQTVALPPTAFRFTDLDLMDPHAYANVFGCLDITNLELGDQQGVNPLFESAIDDLELNLLLAFRPLAQSSAGGMMDLIDATCSTAATCTADAVLASTAYTNQTSGTCLGRITGTVRPYSPAVSDVVGSVASPCFVSASQNLTITISGINIPMRDAQVAGRYSGNPATAVSTGLVRGFLRQDDAEDVILPATAGPVAGRRLASILRGYPGGTATDGTAVPAACNTNNDRDTHATHGVGWWMYINYPAARVTNYTDI